MPAWASRRLRCLASCSRFGCGEEQAAAARRDMSWSPARLVTPNCISGQSGRSVPFPPTGCHPAAAAGVWRARRCFVKRAAGKVGALFKLPRRPSPWSASSRLVSPRFAPDTKGGEANHLAALAGLLRTLRSFVERVVGKAGAFVPLSRWTCYWPSPWPASSRHASHLTQREETKTI